MDSGSEVRRIAEAMLRRIVAGDYPRGLRMPPETEIASEFSCGRSTVREALRHLSDLGVVRSRRGSGAMVLDFRREGRPAILPAYLAAGTFDRPVEVMASELLRLRRLLAHEAVRLAALYGEADELIVAQRELDRAHTLTHDPVAYAQCELDFFRALICASRIWPAVWLANSFWAPMRELHTELAPAVGGLPELFQISMRALLERVRERDTDGARQLLDGFLDQADAHLLSQVAAFVHPPNAPDAVRTAGAPTNTKLRASEPSPNNADPMRLPR